MLDGEWSVFDRALEIGHRVLLSSPPDRAASRALREPVFLDRSTLPGLEGQLAPAGGSGRADGRRAVVVVGTATERPR